MTDKELWQKFCAEKQIDEDTEYDAWAFGDESMRSSSLRIMPPMV